MTHRGPNSLSALLWGAVAWAACGPQGLHAADAAKPLTYDDQVVAVLREKCFSCHNADKTEGGLNMTTYAALMAGGGSGEVVVPGDPNGSLLYKVVTHAEEPVMPPNSGKIPVDMQNVLKGWIAAGALEASGSKPRVSNKPKLDLAVKSSDLGKPKGPPPMPGKLGIEPLFRGKRANAVIALAAAPWSPLVAVGGHKQVLLHHAETLEPLGILPFPEGTPHVLKFSRNGSLLLVGGGRGASGGRVVVFKVETGERVIEVGNEYDVVLAADISLDQSLVALGGPSKVVRVYSTADGELAYEIKKHTDYVTALEFSPDGAFLATGDRSGGLHVWDARKGREYLVLKGHPGGVTDVSWRADGKLLASCGEDGKAKLWEMENGATIKDWAANPGAQSIAFARDGRLATAGRDNKAKVWKADATAAGNPFDRPDIALRVAFSHDDKRVFVGDWTGEVAAYDAATGKLLGSFSSNPPTVEERAKLAEQAVATAKANLTDVEKQFAAVQASATAAEAARNGGKQALEALKKKVDQGAKDKAEAEKVRREAGDAVAKLKTLAPQQAAAKKKADEAAKKADDAAKAKAGDKALADAAAKARAAAKAAGELSAKTEADLKKETQRLNEAGPKVTAAQQSADKAKAAIPEAEKTLARLDAAAKAAAELLAKRQAELAEAKSAVAAAEAALAKRQQAAADAKSSPSAKAASGAPRS